VTTLPGAPRVSQVVPAGGATSSLEPISAPRAQPVASAPVGGAPEAAAPEAAPAGDWHTLVNTGDALMAQRQRDDAMDAYLNAFDLATDGRPVTATEVAQLCKKLANFQMSFGSLAEARQTLEHGRQTLKHMTGGKDGGDRQKYIDQLENSLRSLPRD
jgi:glutamate synthase domain-containing protein 2